MEIMRPLTLLIWFQSFNPKTPKLMMTMMIMLVLSKMILSLMPQKRLEFQTLILKKNLILSKRKNQVNKTLRLTTTTLMKLTYGIPITILKLMIHTPPANHQPMKDSTMNSTILLLVSFKRNPPLHLQRRPSNPSNRLNSKKISIFTMISKTTKKQLKD